MPPPAEPAVAAAGAVRARTQRMVPRPPLLRFPSPRASGGIGRRAGFRFLCPKGRGGSTPPSPTRGCFVEGGEKPGSNVGFVIAAFARLDPVEEPLIDHRSAQRRH